MPSRTLTKPQPALQSGTRRSRASQQRIPQSTTPTSSTSSSQAQQASVTTPTTTGQSQVGSSIILPGTGQSSAANATTTSNNSQPIASGASSSTTTPTNISIRPQNVPARTKKTNWVEIRDWSNSPVGYLTLALTILGALYVIRGYALQKWTAGKDFRDECWTEMDHGIYSEACNNTLAHPMTPPPVKKRSPSLGTIDFGFRALSFLLIFLGMVVLKAVLSSPTPLHQAVVIYFLVCSWLVLYALVKA